MVEIMIWNPVKSDKRREHEMISEKMKPYVKNNSAIRMMFEEGNRLRAKYGADKVFDFSL